jgi:hypothetical protein
MNPDDFPAPQEGFVLPHFLVVSDQDRSREFYRSLFDSQVILERDPVILKVGNSWLILNVGGGPTDDKPTVTLTAPADPNRTSAFLNIRVADIAKVYREWSAKGAEFLTEPKDHGREIRWCTRSGHQSRSSRNPVRSMVAPVSRTCNSSKAATACGRVAPKASRRSSSFSLCFVDSTPSHIRLAPLLSRPRVRCFARLQVWALP